VKSVWTVSAVGVLESVPITLKV
jgi:hypothetical protein